MDDAAEISIDQRYCKETKQYHYVKSTRKEWEDGTIETTIESTIKTPFPEHSFEELCRASMSFVNRSAVQPRHMSGHDNDGGDRAYWIQDYPDGSRVVESRYTPPEFTKEWGFHTRSCDRCGAAYTLPYILKPTKRASRSDREAAERQLLLGQSPYCRNCNMELELADERFRKWEPLYKAIFFILLALFLWNCVDWE